MQTNQNHTWAPPRSPVRIEYSAELLREILGQAGLRDARGVLFGMRNGRDVWILAAHHITGAAPVGVFVARIRGEVFLTESDLEFLDETRTDLALAVVGGKGGFFIREHDGSIQTIQSYQEFAAGSEGTATVVVDRFPWSQLVKVGLDFLYTSTVNALSVRSTGR